jgi:hypothetical protein
MPFAHCRPCARADAAAPRHVPDLPKGGYAPTTDSSNTIVHAPAAFGGTSMLALAAAPIALPAGQRASNPRDRAYLAERQTIARIGLRRSRNIG